MIRNFTFSKRCKYRSLEETLSGCDPEEIDLITRLLKFEPSARLSAAEALKHPYFDGVRANFKRRGIEKVRISDQSINERGKGIEHYRTLINELEKNG